MGKILEACIFGYSISPCEIIFMMRNFPSCVWYNVTYVDSGFFNEQQKSTLMDLSRSYPCSITFKRPEVIEKNSYDCVICLGCAFRQISRNIYNSENKELQLMGFDIKRPIFSDANKIKPFLLAVMNVMRFLLTVAKVDGLVICYPTSISFQVLAAYDGYKDYRIMDHRPEITWAECALSYFPSYLNSPVVLQLEPREKYYSDRYIASELFSDEESDEESLESVTYHLSETSPETISYFGTKGLRVVPSHHSFGCAVQKMVNVPYSVDYELLRQPLQLSTNTFKRIQEDPNVFEDPASRRFLNSIYFGGRYQRCCKDIRRVCRDFDELWLNKSLDL